MKTSVALCTFNGGRFLAEQLHTIGSQTELPIEVVVCDDGSTDTTESIVASFAETVPFPVRFHKNRANIGSTKNFEQAIRLCRGDVIALCDQDDLWLPNKLQSMLALLAAQPTVAGVFSNAALIDGDGTFVAGNLWQRQGFTPVRQRSMQGPQAPFRLAERDTVTGATLVFRSSFIDRLLPIAPEWVHDGWIALILAAISELRPLPECLIQYRLHAAQQIGAQQVAWHDHLSTQREAAIEFHRKTSRRFAAIAERLATLPTDPRLIDYLRNKAAFFDQRARLLQTSPAARIVRATRLLAAYRRFDKGALSYMRDLLH